MSDVGAAAAHLASLAERLVVLLDAREAALSDALAERDRLAEALAEMEAARSEDAALRDEAAAALDAAIGELRAAAEDEEARDGHG